MLQVFDSDAWTEGSHIFHKAVSTPCVQGCDKCLSLHAILNTAVKRALLCPLSALMETEFCGGKPSDSKMATNVCSHKLGKMV